MVYRFSEGAEGLYPDANGDWIEYEDYERMRADRDYWYSKCLDAGLLDEEPEENKNDNT